MIRVMDAYRLLIDRDLPHRERECTSKATFGSRREAKHLARDGKHADGRVSAYRCSFCGLWHLGHRRRGGQKTWVATPAERFAFSNA
jgi:hypothetical protein